MYKCFCYVSVNCNVKVIVGAYVNIDVMQIPIVQLLFRWFERRSAHGQNPTETNNRTSYEISILLVTQWAFKSWSTCWTAVAIDKSWDPGKRGSSNGALSDGARAQGTSDGPP